MDKEIAIFLIPFTILPMVFLCHFLWQQVASKQFPLKQKQIALLIVSLSSVYFFTALWKFGFIVAVFLFITSLCYSYAYFHVFNMANTARRIHLLILILTKQRITKPYELSQMIDLRLERMLEMGLVQEREGKIFAKQSALLLVARLFRSVRHWFYKA